MLDFICFLLSFHTFWTFVQEVNEFSLESVCCCINLIENKDKLFAKFSCMIHLWLKTSQWPKLCVNAKLHCNFMCFWCVHCSHKVKYWWSKYFTHIKCLYVHFNIFFLYQWLKVDTNLRFYRSFLRRVIMSPRELNNVIYFNHRIHNLVEHESDKFFIKNHIIHTKE